MTLERKIFIGLNILLGFIVLLTKEIIPGPITTAGQLATIVFGVCNMIKCRQ
jgi:hypothetical protein